MIPENEEMGENLTMHRGRQKNLRIKVVYQLTLTWQDYQGGPTESEGMETQDKMRRDWLDVSDFRDRRMGLQGSQEPGSKAGKEIESLRFP